MNNKHQLPSSTASQQECLGVRFNIPQQSFVDVSWHSLDAHDIVTRVFNLMAD